MTVEDILKTDNERHAIIDAVYDPINGVNSPPYDRFTFALDDFPERQLPMAMASVPLIRGLMEAGSIARWLRSKHWEANPDNIASVKKRIVRLRAKHDFAYCAATFFKIKAKQGGAMVSFVLSYPQRLVLEQLEKLRLSNVPIRMILLKARQWGGSTLIQMYMAWIQLFWAEGFYSAIVAHQSAAARRVRAMYTKMLAELPPELLGLGAGKLSFTPYEGSATDVIVGQNKKPVRDNVISIGSMQSPDALRSGDIMLAHYSEVGVWKKTDGRDPEEVIQTISSSILNEPMTMDVMESTAKGENNLFFYEWQDAKAHKSARVPVFVAWFQIPMYRLPFANEEERRNFAQMLLDNKDIRETKSFREEPGYYLWYLLSIGATLDAIHWYIERRKSYRNHDTIAAEFPSDDVEAFAHSGKNVFDRYFVELLRPKCRPPRMVGELLGAAVEGGKCLEDLTFVYSDNGNLSIWAEPDRSFNHTNRYVVGVDIGGKGDNSDYSDIVVIDRWWRNEGEGDEVVAEWHGHIRIDLLAWKMAQIAHYYCDAMLVIESNTAEKKYAETEGDNSEYILDLVGAVYPNLYARESSPERIKQGKPTTYGFHTNSKTKPILIGNLTRLIEETAYTERNEEALAEYNIFVRRDDDSTGNAEGRGNHDDRVMARAIALLISEKMPLPEEVSTKKNAQRTYYRTNSASM